MVYVNRFANKSRRYGNSYGNSNLGLNLVSVAVCECEIKCKCISGGLLKNGFCFELDIVSAVKRTRGSRYFNIRILILKLNGIVVGWSGRSSRVIWS